MNTVSLTVNGQGVTANVPPRLHLADFLREHLHLTGTHLGCEHGVCGACTLLLEGKPTRSCITFAVACNGADIRSIEGLDDDIVVAALREAFQAEHALQCGYCTPAMLITARDIVLRLPAADDARVRLELAGNLCRCTGYNGIVRAIRRVLDARLGGPPRNRVSLPTISIPTLIESVPVPAKASPRPIGNALTQRVHLAVPQRTVWLALQDPPLLASCVPGLRLINAQSNHVSGEMIVSLGPIQGCFTGTADFSYDQGALSGTVCAEAQDRLSGTRLSARIEFNVEMDTEFSSILALTVAYNLRGALAQFARGPVVQAFADEIAAIVGQNLQARLSGETIQAHMQPLSATRLIAHAIWKRIKQLVRKKS